MSDLLAECDWRDGTLFLVLPEDPERIGVRLFPSRYAPSRMYVPEAEIVLTKAENAKLRELCAGLLTGYECGHGELCKGCTWDGLGDPKTLPCLTRVKARELGVEVEE